MLLRRSAPTATARAAPQAAVAAGSLSLVFGGLLGRGARRHRPLGLRLVSTASMGPRKERASQRGAHYSSHVQVRGGRWRLRAACRAAAACTACGRTLVHLQAALGSFSRVCAASDAAAVCAASDAAAVRMLARWRTRTRPHTRQVFNVDNASALPSVLLFFDNQRFLFNAGEGIQRHFIEYKQRMTKARACLLACLLACVCDFVVACALARVVVCACSLRAPCYALQP